MVSALRSRIRRVLDNPDVYVQRMFTPKTADTASASAPGIISNPWDQLECELCRSTTDEVYSRMCVYIDDVC